jgi:hypothetical protein
MAWVMLRQLYKHGPDGTRYWEAWEAGDAVILHRGQLGYAGEIQKLPLRPGQPAKDVIDGEAAKARAEGYKLLRPPRRSNLLVQYGVEGLTRARYERKKDRIWQMVNRALVETANGWCLADSISDDERTVTLQASVLDGPTAKDTIVAALKKAKVLKGAVVAYQHASKQWRVLWPETLRGAFSPPW